MLELVPAEFVLCICSRIYVQGSTCFMTEEIWPQGCRHLGGRRPVACDTVLRICNWSLYITAYMTCSRFMIQVPLFIMRGISVQQMKTWQWFLYKKKESHCNCSFLFSCWHVDSAVGRLQSYYTSYALPCSRRLVGNDSPEHKLIRKLLTQWCMFNIKHLTQWFNIIYWAGL